MDRKMDVQSIPFVLDKLKKSIIINLKEVK